MLKVFAEGLALLVGIGLIAFRHQVAVMVVRSQNAFWGFRFGGMEVKISEIIAILAGIGFFVFGLLAIAGALK